MDRQARFDAPGTWQHIVIKGIEKRWIVNDEKDRIDFVNRMGSRRHRIKEVRSDSAWQLHNLGINLIEIARGVGVSSSGISRILQRREFSINVVLKKEGNRYSIKLIPYLNALYTQK